MTHGINRAFCTKLKWFSHDQNVVVVVLESTIQLSLAWCVEKKSDIMAIKRSFSKGGKNSENFGRNSVIRQNGKKWLLPWKNIKEETQVGS